MGSTNGGVSRGQLRPYLTGRGSPFLLAGLLLLLGIAGFSYWGLNKEYAQLESEQAKLQERLRIYGENREITEKQNSALQSQLQLSQDGEGKCKIVSDKKQQEINTCNEQLKMYENDAKKNIMDMEAGRTTLEKCEAEREQTHTQIKGLNEKIKLLESEKQHLIDKLDQLIINTKATKSVHENEIHSHSNVIQPSGLLSEKKSHEAYQNVSGIVAKEPPILDPDVGFPPENREARDIRTTENKNSEQILDNQYPTNDTNAEDKSKI